MAPVTVLETPAPALPKPDTSPSLENKSLIAATYEAANRFSAAKNIEPISAETGNFIIQNINRIAEEARRLKGTEAFNKNPIYAQVIQIKEAHPDLFKAIDIPKPEGKDKKAEKKETHDEQGHDEHAGEAEKSAEGEKKPQKFEINKLSLDELFALDGITRFIAADLAAAEGVDFVDPNLPIKVQEAHHEHLIDRLKVGLSNTLRLSLSTKDAPGDYDLIDDHGHPATTGSTEESLASQFIQLGSKRSSPYAESIRFVEGKPIDRLREIASMHNASIALREAYTGQKSWRALGETNDKFGQDNLSIAVKNQIDKLLSVQYPGKTPDQLLDVDGNPTPELRALKRQALRDAIVEMGGKTKEVYNRQVGNEQKVDIDNLSKARTLATEERIKPNPPDGYIKKIKNPDGTFDEKPLSYDEYRKGQVDIEKKKSEVRDLTVEIESLTKSIEEGIQKQLALESEEKTLAKAISDADTQLKGFPVDFSKPDEVDAYRKRFKETHTIVTETKAGITTDTADTLPPEERARIIAMEKEYQAIQKQKLTNEQRLATIAQEKGELAAQKKQRDDLKETQRNAQEKIDTTTYEALEKPVEKADQIDFVVGKESDEKTKNIVTSRTSHIMETFLVETGEARDRATESFDNFRNVIFGVEGDLKGQEMAKKVLPDVVLISSLMQVMGYPTGKDNLPQTTALFQEWLGNGIAIDFLTQDGLIDMESPRMKGITSGNEVMNVIKGHLLGRLQKNPALTNATIARAVLRERVMAVSIEDGLSKLTDTKPKKLAIPPAPAVVPPAPGVPPTPPAVPTPPSAPPPPGSTPPVPGAPLPPRPGRNRFGFPSRPAAPTGTGTP